MKYSPLKQIFHQSSHGTRATWILKIIHTPKVKKTTFAICQAFFIFMARYLTLLKQLIVTKKFLPGNDRTGHSLLEFHCNFYPEWWSYRLSNSSIWIGLHSTKISIHSQQARIIPWFHYHGHGSGLSLSERHLLVFSLKYSGISLSLTKKGMDSISHITELSVVATNSNKIYGKSPIFFPVLFVISLGHMRFRKKKIRDFMTWVLW